MSQHSHRLIPCNADKVLFSFGFRDGLSQPLLKGINSPEALKADPYMQTNQNIITVTSKPPGTQDGIESDPKRRPPWMVNGSFLAFRKLEQDVQRWIDLVNRFADAGCKNPDHCGAKLMGRWRSGKYPETSPISSFFSWGQPADIQFLRQELPSPNSQRKTPLPKSVSTTISDTKA